MHQAKNLIVYSMKQLSKNLFLDERDLLRSGATRAQGEGAVRWQVRTWISGVAALSSAEMYGARCRLSALADTVTPTCPLHPLQRCSAAHLSVNGEGQGKRGV